MLPVCRTPDAVYAMPPWLYPGRIDLYIHTIRLVKEKNATSRRLCQGKSSLRPAPHHNCTTKVNWRMSLVAEGVACRCMHVHAVLTYSQFGQHDTTESRCERWSHC